MCLPTSCCNIIGEFGYVKRQLSSNTYLSGLLSHYYRLRLNFGVLTRVKGIQWLLLPLGLVACISNGRFMRQARRKRHFARSIRRAGNAKNWLYWLPKSNYKTLLSSSNTFGVLSYLIRVGGEGRRDIIRLDSLDKLASREFNSRVHI